MGRAGLGKSRKGGFGWKANDWSLRSLQDVQLAADGGGLAFKSDDGWTVHWGVL